MDASMGYGAAASFVGGIMQSIAASQAQKRMGRAFAEELRKQGKYRQEAFGSVENYLPSLGVETARQQMAQGQTQRLADYAQVGATPFALGQTMNPREQSYYDMTGANRARLSSYGDWGTQQGIARQREAQDLFHIEDTARGELGVFPYDMYKAQHSMDELAFWGNLISSIGGSSGNWSQLFGSQQGQRYPQARPESANEQDYGTGGYFNLAEG